MQELFTTLSTLQGSKLHYKLAGLTLQDCANALQQSHSSESLQIVALLGSILLLLDKCIPSSARERSIVAYVRLNSGSQSVSSQALAVIGLFASTGFEAGSTKAPTGQHTGLDKSAAWWHCQSHVFLS